MLLLFLLLDGSEECEERRRRNRTAAGRRVSAGSSSTDYAAAATAARGGAAYDADGGYAAARRGIKTDGRNVWRAAVYTGTICGAHAADAYDATTNGTDATRRVAANDADWGTVRWRGTVRCCYPIRCCSTVRSSYSHWAAAVRVAAARSILT